MYISPIHKFNARQNFLLPPMRNESADKCYHTSQILKTCKHLPFSFYLFYFGQCLVAFRDCFFPQNQNIIKTTLWTQILRDWVSVSVQFHLPRCKMEVQTNVTIIFKYFGKRYKLFSTIANWNIHRKAEWGLHLLLVPKSPAWSESFILLCWCTAIHFTDPYACENLIYIDAKWKYKQMSAKIFKF